MRPCLDSVAVRAPDYTLFDFALCGRYAFGVAYVHALVGVDMIEMKRRRMLSEAAITTTSQELVVIEPPSNTRCSFVGTGVDRFPIPWHAKAVLSPQPGLFRRWGCTIADFILTPRRAVLGSGAFRGKRISADDTDSIRQLNRFPWRHKAMVAETVHPYKPSIFEKIYEPVED